MKCKIDYASGGLNFSYLQNDLDTYIKEYTFDEEAAVRVFYYDKDGVKRFLQQGSYTLDPIDHKVILKNNGNILTTPNEISEFYITIIPESRDYTLATYEYTFNPSLNMSDTLALTHWEVSEGEQFDVIPNFNALYYMNEKESTFTNSLCYATQITSFLEVGEELMFTIADELPEDVVSDIASGEYASLFINTIIDNYDALDTLTVELRGPYAKLGEQRFSREELLSCDFKLQIDLTDANSLHHLTFIPEFRTDDEYSDDNAIGIPYFEFIEWNEDLVIEDEDGNMVMMHILEKDLFTDESPLEVAYLFNDMLQYLKFPEGIAFDWEVELDAFEREIFYLLIPSEYINPNDNAEVNTFENGDMIILRYNTPVDKVIQLGVERMYLNKKPNDPSLPFAEVMLINTNNSNDYSTFLDPYCYTLSLNLTPFNTEYLGTYMNILVDINFTTLEEFAQYGYLDFSHVVISVPDPAYELTLHEIAIVQEYLEGSEYSEEFYSRIWQFTERANFTSSEDPEQDSYHFTYNKIPLYYNDLDDGKWLEYLKIYDDNYNYYSAGLFGDEYQLLWNPVSGNFTWNNGFAMFQDYWGMQIELPAMIEPNTTLYFEYCYNDSWNTPIVMQYENILSESIDLVYNWEYLLTPRYEMWYGEIYDNTNNGYDYEVEQYYSEAFTVYDDSPYFSYTFEADYNFTTDFLNMSLFKVIGMYANFTETELVDDDTNYDISFDVNTKEFTIAELISGGGHLNQFDLITVIVNFTLGPISQRTLITFSEYFNETYLSDMESTFYDYISCSFDYVFNQPTFLLAETERLLVSSSTSFVPINYSKNTDISINFGIEDYETNTIYEKFEIHEDKYNTIYVADLDFDGEVDYKQEIDIDKDDRIDIVRYGIDDSENVGEVIWYRIIQEFEADERTFNKQQDEEQRTNWFYINDLGVWAQRSVQEQSNVVQMTNTKFYSVKLDTDLDGYADSQMTYQRTTDTIIHENIVNEWTALAKISNDVFMAIGHHLTVEIIESDDISKLNIDLELLSKLGIALEFIEEVITGIKESYTKFSEITTLSHTEQSIQEVLTYTDWEEGEVTSTRTYINMFSEGLSELSYRNLKSDVFSTLSVYNEETDQTQEISGLPFFIANFSQIDWHTEVWGLDAVPIQFDTLYSSYGEDDYTVENYYEGTYCINLRNRFSLYHDYQKDFSDDVIGSTLFNVKGIFITPIDGRVYYTSDKYAYQSFNQEMAKTDGHYLYYDSDENGFYETVYVLAPNENEDEVYEVISIIYNYDGKHEITPYEIIDSERSFTGNYISRKIIGLDIEGTIINKFGGSVNELKKRLDEWYGQITDGYITKDHVFEIYRLLPLDDINKFAPALFYDTYLGEYGRAWNMYNKQFWDDVWEQVGMMTKAGYISAATSILISTLFTNLATAWVGLIAAGIFALVYWIDSMNAQEAKRREQQNLISSQTFHSLDSEKDQPNNMNQKALNGGLWEHYGGHPSAKYTLVTTGEVNPQFTGKIIVSPPNNLRIATDADLADEFNLEFFGLQETYDTIIEEGMTEEEIQDMMPEFKMFNYIRQSYSNLDFLLISSELPSYNSIEHYSFEYGTEDYRTDTYNKHQGFTLGFLEQSIISASRGEYDAVRPMCINGRPAYIYINTNDDLSQLTQPLSPLYQPVVISNERYGELFLDSIIPDSTISVDVQSTLLEEPYTFGINASDLIYYELERGYKAKIPLYSDEFNYPISMITVEVIASDTSSDLLSSTYFATYVSEIELTSSQYTLEGGNLYFYSSFDEIVLSTFNYKVLKDEFIELTQNWEEGTLSYRVNIYFPQVIADTSTTLGVIDTVSNDVGRNALAQTTQFLISDYFNAFTLAESFALAQAEVDYIAKITTVSTLISSLFLAPSIIASAGASVLSKGIEKVAQNTLTTTLSKEVLKNVGVNIIKYIASLPIQVLTEVFEELYIDSLIEETFAKWGDSNGFWASLVCSVREVVFGAPSAFISGLKSNSQSNTQTSTSSLLHGYDMIQDHSLDFGLSQSQQQAFMDTQTSKINYESLAEHAPTIFQGIMSLPGFFFGGFGLGFIGIAFDLTIDNMFDVQLARYLGEKEVQRLIQQQAPLDLNNKFSALELNAEPISNFPQIKNVLAMAKGIAAINPSQYSSSEFTAQVQLRMNTLEKLGTYIQTMKGKQENIEKVTHQVKAIEHTAPLDSDEASVTKIVVREDMEALATEVDPVIKIGNILRWIQPLPADEYGLDHDMTLNELLEKLGLLNHQYKWLGFTDQYGNHYVLKDKIVVVTDEGFREIRGDMSLKEVFEIIGYDTTNLKQQMHGMAPSLVVEASFDNLLEDLVSIPFWMSEVVEYKEGKSFLVESYPDVVNFLLEFDYRTGRNMIESIRTEEHAQVIQDFLDNVFNPSITSFTTKYYKNIKNIRSIMESGIQNALKQTLLSKNTINDFKSKFTGFDQKKYEDFVKNQLYDFKFGDIITASLEKDLHSAFSRAISKMVFNYIAQKELDLQSLTDDNFIEELQNFINRFSDKSFKKQFNKEILHSNRITDLFLTLAENFMTTEYDSELGEMIGTIAKNPSTFHGWIGEVMYLFNQYMDRIVPALIEVNWNLDHIKIFQWTERNPQYQSRLKASSFVEGILAKLLGGDLKKARELINGFSTAKYLKLLPNGREADILALLLPGSDVNDLSTYILHTTELKTIRSTTTNLKEKPEDISLDVISLIIDALEIWALTPQSQSGQIQGFRQISDFASGMYGLSDGEQYAKMTLKYVLENIQSSDNLLVLNTKGDGKKNKGAFDLQLCHQVASLLSTKIQGKTFATQRQVEAEIGRLLSDQTVKGEIKNIAKRIYEASMMYYGVSKWNILESQWDTEFIRLETMFKSELKNIIVSLSNNQYKLVWQDSIIHSFLRFELGANGKLYPVILEGHMLTSDSNFFGIMEYDSSSGQWRTQPRIPGQFETFNVPMAVIYDTGSNKWGLVRSDQLQYFAKLDKRYGLGFKSPSGEIFTDVILNTKEGYILDGRIALEGNQLKDRADSWFEKYLNDPRYFSQKDGVFTFNNFYRNIMHITGAHIVALLQDITYNFVPTPTYEPYFKDNGIQRANKLKQLIQQYAVSINLNRYNVPGMERKINMLVNFLYQIGGEHTMQMVRTGVPMIFINEDYLNAFSSEKRYSIPLYKDLLKALKPKSGDPLYSDSNYDSNFDPSHDSNDDLYWLNLISRSFIENDERKIRPNLDQKQFYNAWLKLLQNDFARQNSKLQLVIGGDKLAYYASLLQGESFTSGSDLIIDETKNKNDFKLIEKIDNILQDLFGYNAYTDLISGFLSFSEDSIGCFDIDWILHTKIDQSKLISKYDLRTLSYTRSDLLRQDYLYGYDKEYSQSAWYFSNIKINGFWRSFSGIQITSSGIHNIENYRLETRPNDHSFLDNYFSSYQHLEDRLYAKANNLFLGREFSKTFDQEWINKMNFKGRLKVQEFFYKIIKETLENLKMKGILKDGFEAENTEKMAQSFARTFIDDPTNSFDFVRDLRNIIFNGKDDYITLKAEKKGRSKIVSQAAFFGNDLIEKGLRLFIPYKEAMRYIDDIWFTLNFYASRDGSMHPKYQLDIDFALRDLSPKILEMYRKFYDLFKGGDNDVYKIIFTTEKGKGLSRTNYFHITFDKLGFKAPDSIILDRRSQKDFQQKVATLVFYLIFIPNSFAVITSGTADISPKFAYADALGLYTHDYVQSSKYKSTNYGGSFIWVSDSGQYTPENYKVWMKTFQGVIKPSDLRLFLAFSNQQDEDILDYLMNFFNQFMKDFGETVNERQGIERFNVHDFKDIVDFREPEGRR